MKKLKASDLINIDEDFLDSIAKRLEDRNSTQAKEFYTVNEIAKKVKINAYTIRTHIKNYINEEPGKKLKASLIGKSYRIAYEDLQTYLNNTVK